MSFITDKQTLDDLNLLGKYKPGSVYSLFNKVQTRGGERLLEEMFRSPLSDPGEINQRSGVFLYLQGMGFVFPFDHDEFSLVEDYLGSGSAGSLLATGLDVLRRRVMDVVVKDESYGIIREGVRKTVLFLNRCREFMQAFDEADPANPLREEIGAAKKILSHPRLAGLPGWTGDLSWQRVAGLHHLFVQVLQDELERLCGILCHLDVYITVSNVAAERGFSYAKALPENDYSIRAADLRHPAIDKAVGNPISLDTRQNVLFLTGANMAGKSTFMKSFGIALYLAHMGFPVAAAKMVFSVRDGLYSSINVPDDLSKGYSHFYAEVQRVKTIAEEVSRSKSLVVIFDELFKGTNVKDAYDATLAVTAAFSEYRNCCFIISTHIIEVGDSLKETHDNLQFVYLPTVMEGVKPRYTYQLKTGITSDRHGMMIIEQEGILDIIGTHSRQEN
jgi:DNA mismatch repair ATPase MutS